MAQILARDLPDETVAALKRRAHRNHRSLSREIRSILEESLAEETSGAPETARKIRANLAARGILFADSGEAQAEDRTR